MENNQEIQDIIDALAVRKKQFVFVKRSLMNKLQDELIENYPKAEIDFIGLSGNGLNAIRKSSAKTLKSFIRQ